MCLEALLPNGNDFFFISRQRSRSNNATVLMHSQSSFLIQVSSTEDTWKHEFAMSSHLDGSLGKVIWRSHLDKPFGQTVWTSYLDKSFSQLHPGDLRSNWKAGNAYWGKPVLF